MVKDGPELCSSPLDPGTRLRLGTLGSLELPVTEGGSEVGFSRF